MRGGSAAGGGAGGPHAGEGQPGRGGSVPGGHARGRGFFVRCASARSGQRRRRGAAAALWEAGVSPPPLLAPHRRLQFRVLGRPPGSSGHFSVFKNNGGGGCPGSPQGSQEGSGRVGMGSGDVWRAFGRWGNQGRAAAFGAGFRRR